ncbi:MAG: hypothetical protein RR626_09145, partial [Anaerovoracaceae bacterium]
MKIPRESSILKAQKLDDILNYFKARKITLTDFEGLDTIDLQNDEEILAYAIEAEFKKSDN